MSGRRPNPDFTTGARVSEGSRVGVVAETTPGTRAAGMVDVVFEGGYGGPERRPASGLKRMNPVNVKLPEGWRVDVVGASSGLAAVLRDSVDIVRGRVSAEPSETDPSVWTVGLANVPKPLQGKGYGLAMYEKLLLAVSKRGASLAPSDFESGGNTSGMAHATWGRLRKVYRSGDRGETFAEERVNPIPELVKGKKTPYKEMGLHKVPFDRRWEFRQKIAGKNEKRGWSGGADVRTWYAVGSGKCWVGCISFRTEYGDDRYIDVGLTLQSGPSWGVAENKVERWFFGPDTKDALSETGAGGLTFLKWAADQLKAKITSENELVTLGGRSSTIAVSWADDQRRRVYAWLERLGFHFGHDADGDPAYILRLGDSNVTSHTRTRVNPRTAFAVLGNPRTAEGWEVYDPSREQFNATVQGVYESLAARDLRKPFYDARRNRADVKALASGAWSTDDVRRVLSQAFAIATSQGQKHGFLVPGTNAPTARGAARSEARYAAAEAAHRVENRTDYETTLRLARKDQKTRVVVEGGKLVVPRAPIQLLTGNARRNPLVHATETETGFVVSGTDAFGHTRSVTILDRHTGSHTRSRARANNLVDDVRSGSWYGPDFKDTFRENPIKSKTKQIGVVGVGNYLGSIRTGAPAESTPTTLYTVGPALDPDKVGYFVLTCSPFKKDVQNALRDIGGWTLLPNVTSTAYLNTLGVTVKRGGVVEQSAPAVHKVYKEATLKGARYTVVDARDISRGEFSNKADAFEFAKIRDRKVAQLGVPQVHDVQKTAYGWEVFGPGYGETSEMEALKFDNAKRNEERTIRQKALAKEIKAAKDAGLSAQEHRLREDWYNVNDQDPWETDLFYNTEEQARRVAEKLDFRAASKGALPIKGFRTKAGIGGQKAEDIFNKTIAIFDQKRVHYVLDRSIVPAEKLTEAKLKLRSADRLRAQATHLGESPEKLAAIEDEAYLRGRKTLINKILKIVDRQAEQKLLDYASSVWGATKLAAVLAEPRSTTKMRATLPGGFNVPARAFGEDRKTGFSKEATTWEHLAGRLWPKGGIPQQFFPVFSYKVLAEWPDDTLRILAKKCGYSDAQIKKFETGAETSALAKVLATHDARSTIDQIRMGKIEHDIPLAQRVAMERQRAGTARVAGGAVKPMRAPRDTSRAPLPPVDKEAAEILKQARQPVAPSYVGLPQLPKPVPVEESVLARAAVASESAEDRRARVALELAALEAEVERQRKLLPKVSAGVGSHAPSWGTTDASETPLARDLREAARALSEADTKPKRRSKKSNPRHRRTA